MKAGDEWDDHGLIFASEVGTPLDPSNVRRTFTRISKRAGLGDNFPYLLRHTAASLFIDGGASIEEVADLFGMTLARCTTTTATGPEPWLMRLRG